MEQYMQNYRLTNGNLQVLYISRVRVHLVAYQVSIGAWIGALE